MPITEDINKDQSSIYLTSNQKINIEVSSKNYNSYTEQPISPKEYDKNQIILNSGRLLFNTIDNDILFSSKKSINFNSVNSINIDTKDFIISSNQIYLGDKTATEPILKGNITITQLSALIDTLIQFFTIYGNEPPNAKVGSTPLAGTSIVGSLNTIKSTLETQSKSKYNFTI